MKYVGYSVPFQDQIQGTRRHLLLYLSPGLLGVVQLADSGGVIDLPGANHNASPVLCSYLCFSKILMASCEHPMLLPSATNLQPAEIKDSASSPETCTIWCKRLSFS